MDLYEFVRQIADLLNRVNIECVQQGQSIRCGAISIVIRRGRRGRAEVMDREFARAEAAQAAAWIISRLPGLVDEEIARRKLELRKTEVRILATGSTERNEDYISGFTGVNVDRNIDIGISGASSFQMKFKTDDPVLFRRALDLLIMLKKGGSIHDDGDAMLRTILQSPEEDVTSLAYADWLEENGQEERAIRLRQAIRDRDECR